jgi:hypothetical protein
VSNQARTSGTAQGGDSLEGGSGMQVHLRYNLGPSGLPSVLFPSEREGRVIHRPSMSRRAVQLGQLLLITLAAVALTTFLRQALA